jgi:hypothetical protein
MHPLWAKFLPAVLYLGVGSQPLKLRPPPLISLAAAPSLQPRPAPRPSLWPANLLLDRARSGPGLRLWENVELTAGKIMNSSGAAFLYAVRPGLALGVRPSVETFDLPGGRFRVPEMFAVFRFQF